VVDCDMIVHNEEGHEIENILLSDIQKRHYIEFQGIKFCVSSIFGKARNTDVEGVPGLIRDESGGYRLKVGFLSNCEPSSDAQTIPLGPRDVLIGGQASLWFLHGNQWLLEVIKQADEKGYLPKFRKSREIVMRFFMLSEQFAYFHVIFEGGRFWKQRKDGNWARIVDWKEVLYLIFNTIVCCKELFGALMEGGEKLEQ